MPPIVIRAAGPADAGTIVRLIRALAAYEDLEDLVRITEADVLRDGFGARPWFECLLAEAGGEVLGFAIHRPSYSTFEGRPGLYVEDLFVTESARQLGIGRLLMARLAAIARGRGCTRISLAVLHWKSRARVLSSSRFRAGRGLAALPALRRRPCPSRRRGWRRLRGLLARRAAAED